MKKAISSFASANANKVLHMKKSTKIALGITAAATAAVAGAVAVKAVQAKKQERSIKSLVVEDAMRRLPCRCAEQVSYEEAFRIPFPIFQGSSALPSTTTLTTPLCCIPKRSTPTLLSSIFTATTFGLTRHGSSSNSAKGLPIF